MTEDDRAIDMKEVRYRARLAWNNWPDSEASRRELAAHEARDPISAASWDRVVEAIRAEIEKSIPLYLGPSPSSDGALREALQTCREFIRGEQIENAVVCIGSMQSLGKMIDEALANNPGGEIKSSDGSVEGHALQREGTQKPFLPDDHEGAGLCEAGIKPGPSEATQPEPEAVTVDDIIDLLDEEGFLASSDGDEERIATAILSRFDVRRR